MSQTQPAKPATSKPYARTPTTANSHWYLGHLVSMAATSKDTGGGYAIMDVVAYKGGEPPRHLHRNEDEAYYILEGRATFYVGEDIFYAGPGTFIFVPRTVPHSFTFESDRVHMLMILSPGGSEKHFSDSRFSQPAKSMTVPGKPTEKVDEHIFEQALRREGTELVGPPGALIPDMQRAFD